SNQALMTTRGNGRECPGHVAVRLLGLAHSLPLVPPRPFYPLREKKKEPHPPTSPSIQTHRTLYVNIPDPPSLPLAPPHTHTYTGIHTHVQTDTRSTVQGAEQTNRYRGRKRSFVERGVLSNYSFAISAEA
ncbi:hypothetical protein WH47_10360, partial [Habropoda laboriosa]